MPCVCGLALDLQRFGDCGAAWCLVALTYLGPRGSLGGDELSIAELGFGFFSDVPGHLQRGYLL